MPRSTLISQRVLSRLRGEKKRLMPDRGTIKRAEPIRPNYEASYDLATNVQGRVTAGFGTFRDVAERFQGVTAYTITVPVNQDIRPGDWWIDEEGRVYRILDTRPSGSYQTEQQCLVELIH